MLVFLSDFVLGLEGSYVPALKLTWNYVPCWNESRIAPPLLVPSLWSSSSRLLGGIPTAVRRSYILYTGVQVQPKPEVDPIVPQYRPRIRNPYEAHVMPLRTTFKTEAHSPALLKEAKGPILYSTLVYHTI